MKPYAQASSSFSTVDGMDPIRVSPIERRMARASMRHAELIAAMLLRANKDLRHVFGFIGRGITGALARRKVFAVTPEWRFP